MAQEKEVEVEVGVEATNTSPVLEMKLELVPIPVRDIERAKAFYVEKLGFNLDHDVQVSASLRVVQLTPVGSACSIVISVGLWSEVAPGSVKGLHLVVADLNKVREVLLSRGVEVGTIVEHGGGIRSAGLQDPDGNSWLLQEIARHA